MAEKTYTSAIKLTEDIWKRYSKPQKEALLRSLGLDESFAKTKTIRELVRRGGGMVARDLKEMSIRMLKKQGGSVTINW